MTVTSLIPAEPLGSFRRRDCQTDNNPDPFGREGAVPPIHSLVLVSGRLGFPAWLKKREAADG